MNRMKELENAVKKYWEERTEKKRSYLEQHYEEMKPELQKKLKWLLDDQKNKEKDGGHRKIQSLYLYRLLTSAYTESYEAIIGMANSDLYLDEDKSETYWFADLVYRDIDEDMKEIEVLLRKRFIHLQEYELFQLKNILLNDDWELLQEIFLHLIKDSIELVLNSGLRMESELQILTGNYMDRPKVLGNIPTV